MLIPANAPVTMSSREIADLTGKEHKNVIRDIRDLLTGLKSEPSEFEGSYKDATGRTLPCFNLPKRECLILVSGYSVELRARIIDRWMELEDGLTASVASALNDPSQLRALLLDNVNRVIALEARVEADKPKTAFFDAYVNADGLYTLQNAGRVLNCHPNLFCRWLKQGYVFYQGTALVPRVQYIANGVFEVKTEIIDDKARPRSFVTAKGIEYFSKRVPDQIKLRGAALNRPAAPEMEKAS